MRKTLIIIVSVIVGAIIGTVVLVFGVLPAFEDECAGDECTQTDGPTLVPVPLPTRMPTREVAYKRSCTCTQGGGAAGRDTGRWG